MCVTARKLGCACDAISGLRDAANVEVDRATSIFEIHEAWRRFAAGILDEAARLYSPKRQKLVERARRMIAHNLEDAWGKNLSMSGVASELGVSASHMSRTFKRETGQTFEQYVIAKRMEMARRLLLDPLHNISEVARLCGFSDPSYFARVFRKFTGCSPSEYCADPLLHPGRADIPAEDHDSEFGLARQA
jgi:AraC-like DNA-binding protein